LTYGFGGLSSPEGYETISGIVTNGSTSGIIQLQFATGQSGYSTTVYANSYLIAKKR